MKAANLMTEAASLTMRAANLLAQGRLAEAEGAERQASELRTRAFEIARQEATREVQLPLDVPFAASQSDRRAIAEGLSEIDAIASPRLVAEYVAARFNKAIAPKSFASVRRDERKAWTRARGSRPVFVVPALDGGQFIPARGMLALSNWETWRRLVGPRTGRVEHLRAALSMLDQWTWLAGGRDDAAAARMQRLLVQLVHSVPGATVGWRLLPTERVREAIEREIAVLGRDDEEWRRSAADRARSQLDQVELVWGAEPIHAVELTAAGGDL